MSSDDVSRKMLNIVRDLAKWQTGIDGVHEPSAKSILSNSKSLTFMSLGLRDAKIKDISSCIQSVATLANEIEVENYNKDDPHSDDYFLEKFHKYRDVKFLMVRKISSIFNDNESDNESDKESDKESEFVEFLFLSITMYMMIVSECESNLNLYEDSEYDSIYLKLNQSIDLIKTEKTENDLEFKIAESILLNYDGVRKSIRYYRRYDSLTSRANYLSKFKEGKSAIYSSIKLMISLGLDSSQN